jgi:outer membrane protein assembly factor BamB
MVYDFRQLANARLRLFNRFGSGGSSISPYSSAPNSAHVLWSNPFIYGGILGGPFGDKQYYQGLSYEEQFYPLILNGKIIFAEHYMDYSTVYQTRCVDLYTGKDVWILNNTNILCAQVVEIDTPNGHGGLAYLWENPTGPSTNSTFNVYDAVSTRLEFTVTNVTLGGVGSIGEVWCIGNKPKDWSMFLGDPSHSADGAGPTILTPKWNYQAGGPIISSPTIANGIAYFGSIDNNIYAVNANSGAKIWTFNINFPIKSTVAVIDGKLYTGADDGFVCLDAATGTQLWKVSAGNIKLNEIGITLAYTGSDLPRSSPMVLNGKVYVGALDGNLYCLDANSGTVLWKYQTGGSILATPTILNNAVYIASCTPRPNGTFYKLDANSGNMIWSFTIPYNLTASPGTGNYLLSSATVAPDLNMVFVRNGLRMNYALNASTGAVIWTYDGIFNPGTPNQLGGGNSIKRHALQIRFPLFQ